MRLTKQFDSYSIGNLLKERSDESHIWQTGLIKFIMTAAATMAKAGGHYLLKKALILK